MVAFLDSGNNIIETKIMSEGSIGEATVYPREILKYALACDCNTMVLAHNHPGGSKKSSPEDRALTQRMVDIFHPLQIKILDHIIVSGTGYTSMAEKGIVPYQSKDTANYEEITLGPIPAKEKRSKFQGTHLR